LTVFGEEAERTTPWYSPINVSTAQDTLLNNELSKHEMNIGFVKDSIENIKLTEEEQRQYQIDAGQRVKKDLTTLVSSPEYIKLSNEEQRKLIQKTLIKLRPMSVSSFLLTKALKYQLPKRKLPYHLARRWLNLPRKTRKRRLSRILLIPMSKE